MVFGEYGFHMEIPITRTFRGWKILLANHVDELTSKFCPRLALMALPDSAMNWTSRWQTQSAKTTTRLAVIKVSNKRLDGRITQRDSLTCGYNDQCPLRLDMRAGVPRLTTHHTDECRRLRMYSSLYDSNDAKWKSKDKRISDLRKRQGMDEKKNILNFKVNQYRRQTSYFFINDPALELILCQSFLANINSV